MHVKVLQTHIQNLKYEYGYLKRLLHFPRRHLPHYRQHPNISLSHPYPYLHPPYYTRNRDAVIHLCNSLRLNDRGGSDGVYGNHLIQRIRQL